ncbi:MAG: MFS transporter [Clostridiales bacterium]|nr:MFS transporter [Clostridiales bacterium]
MKSRARYLSGMYIFSYAAIGALFPLIAQYLSGIGFSGSQIGIITSSSTAIGILSNSFWGGIYHRRRRTKKLIQLLCVATALLSLLMMTVGKFWIFLLLYIIVFFFENPVYPLIDSTIIEVNYPFGTIRKWGAVGFALGIGVAGAVADRFGLLSIFPMFAAFFLLTALLIGIYLKRERAYNQGGWIPQSSEEWDKLKESKKEGSYKDLLHNGKYMALIFSAFFFVGPALSHNTYFSFLYIEVGGTIAGMGIVLLLMVISEAPFMAWSERISSALTMERAILLAMAVSAFRFLWYSTNPSVEFLAATFMLQGIANGIGIVEITKYVAKLAGPAMISLAIPLYTAISSNCGAITCQFFGGIIVESYGGRGVYLFYGLLNLVGVLIYLLFGLYKRKGEAL